jgi:hypothetical protein
MKSGICEKACAILRATRDGEDLLPWQLNLVENAVNGFLNELGWRVFDRLHDEVAAGTHRAFTAEVAAREFPGG